MISPGGRASVLSCLLARLKPGIWKILRERREDEVKLR